jgi:HK97 gp10 family phage protein
MARKIKIFLVGSGVIAEHLRGLSSNETKIVIQNACKEALKPAQQTARAMAPRRTGRLRQSIRIRVLKRSRKRVGARITTNQSDNQFTGKTFYGAFQEFGWKTGKRGSPNRRPVAARKFMKNAIAAHRDQALDIFRGVLRDHVRKVVSKRKG